MNNIPPHPELFTGSRASLNQRPVEDDHQAGKGDKSPHEKMHLPRESKPTAIWTILSLAAIFLALTLLPHFRKLAPSDTALLDSQASTCSDTIYRLVLIEERNEKYPDSWGPLIIPVDGNHLPAGPASVRSLAHITKWTDSWWSCNILSFLKTIPENLVKYNHSDIAEKYDWFFDGFEMGPGQAMLVIKGSLKEPEKCEFGKGKDKGHGACWLF